MGRVILEPSGSSLLYVGLSLPKLGGGVFINKKVGRRIDSGVLSECHFSCG